tara:strand:+ start:1304 stop:1510 length:207 start_codon:yes stop_codon:yes gene_type:complete
MCIICDQFKDGKLSLVEAVRNYGEMRETLSAKHQKEMEEKLFNNFPFYYPLSEFMGDDEYWEEMGFGD